jgi:hypothetical protein
MGGACRRMGVLRNACKHLVRSSEGKRFERLRRRWEDNIRMDIRKVG